MKKKKTIWILAIILICIGVGLCFIPALTGQTTQEPDFTPLSQEELDNCPATEPLANPRNRISAAHQGRLSHTRGR